MRLNASPYFQFQSETSLCLALSLLMAFVLGANNHDFAVSFDDFALIAHGFY